MATADPSSVARNSGNDYIDALIWGDKWVGGDVSYVTVDDSELPGVDDQPVATLAWSDTETAQVTAALQTWAAVANFTFTESQETGANLELYKISLEGMVELTGEENVEGAQLGPDGTEDAGDGAYNSGIGTWFDGALQSGGYSFATLIHEFGHAIGLAHPHDNGGAADEGGIGDGSPLFPGVSGAEDFGTNDQNQQIFTIMSYNVGWSEEPLTDFEYGSAMTPMAFDIAAIQHIYGVNASHASEDSTYALPDANVSGVGYACLWDTGGTDEITFDGAGSVTIDLREAPLTGENAGGYVSWASGISGGYTIANGVIIENASGGSGNDTLTGNDAANSLDGDAGADLLSGGAAADAVSGDLGEDILYGNLGGDILYGNVGADIVYGGQGDDVLYGGQSNGGVDVLYGNLGDDSFHGGEGIDWIYSGAGADRIVIDDLNGFDVIADFDVSAGDRVLINSGIDGEAIGAVADILARASDNADGNAEIDLGGGHMIRLIGVSASDLTEAYFELY